MRPSLILLSCGLLAFTCSAQSPSPAAPPVGFVAPSGLDCPSCVTPSARINHSQHTGPAPAISEEALRAYGWVIAQRAGLNLNLTPEQRRQVLAGINDCIAGEPEPAKVPTLSEEIAPFISAKRAESNQKQLATSKAKSAKFFAEQEGKPGIKRTASGLMYEILREGAGPLATDKDTVTVNYVGSEISGRIFDSSEKQGNKPIELNLSQTAVKGLVEGLKLVGKGGKARLYVNAELGFGDEPDAGPVPPGEGFVFEFEVVSIAPSSKPVPPPPPPAAIEFTPAPSAK